MFLHPRVSFWVALSIPISFLGMFFLAPSAPITINMMTIKMHLSEGRSYGKYYFVHLSVENFGYKRVDFNPNGKRNQQNRGISGYKRISWEEALDIVSNEIKRVKKQHGPGAIVNSHGSHLSLIHI